MMHAVTEQQRAAAVERVASLKARGGKAFKGKMYSTAVELYTQAIRAAAGSGATVPSTDLAAVAKMCKQGVGHDADVDVAALYSNRSLALTRTREYAQAALDGLTAVELKPDWVKGYYRAGVAFSELMEWDQAIAVLAKAKSMAPSDSNVQKALDAAVKGKRKVSTEVAESEEDNIIEISTGKDSSSKTDHIQQKEKTSQESAATSFGGNGDVKIADKPVIQKISLVCKSPLFSVAAADGHKCLVPPSNLSDGDKSKAAITCAASTISMLARCTPHSGRVTPAVSALAEWIVGTDAGRATVRDKVVVQLSCGVALPTMSAAIAGARKAIASDWIPESLENARKMLELNTIPGGAAQSAGLSKKEWHQRTSVLDIDWRRCNVKGFDWRKDYLTMAGFADTSVLVTAMRDPTHKDHARAIRARMTLPREMPSPYQDGYCAQADVVILADVIDLPEVTALALPAVLWALANDEERSGEIDIGSTSDGICICSLPAERNGVPDFIDAMKRAGFEMTKYPQDVYTFERRAVDASNIDPALRQMHAPVFADALTGAINFDSDGSITDEDGETDQMNKKEGPRYDDLDGLDGRNLGMSIIKHFNKIKGTQRKLKNRKKIIKKKSSSVSKHLEKHGWAVCDNFISVEMIYKVREEINLLTAEYEASEIWVGKTAGVGAMLQVPSVRGDRVLWMCGGHLRDGKRLGQGKKTTSLSGSSKANLTSRNDDIIGKESGALEPCNPIIKKAMLAASGGSARMSSKTMQQEKFSSLRTVTNAIDALVINQMSKQTLSLENIRERSDIMLAIYPGEGARFQRHVDNTKKDGRKLTVLLYLNPEWQPENGGSLRLWPSNRDSKDNAESAFVDVGPQAGRLALFYADTMQHEVTPTFAPRHSMTVWYYDTKELQEAEQASRNANQDEIAKQNHNAGTNEEAKEWMKALVGDVSEPTQDTVVQLSKSASKLSEGALGILASITGAASASQFLQGVERLTPASVQGLRLQFQKMGIN